MLRLACCGRAAAVTCCCCCERGLELGAVKPYAERRRPPKAAQQNAEFSMTVLLRAERASGGSGGASLDRRCFSMTFRCGPPLSSHAL